MFIIRIMQNIALIILLAACKPPRDRHEYSQISESQSINSEEQRYEGLNLVEAAKALNQLLFMDFSEGAAAVKKNLAKFILEICQGNKQHDICKPGKSNIFDGIKQFQESKTTKFPAGIKGKFRKPQNFEFNAENKYLDQIEIYKKLKDIYGDEDFKKISEFLNSIFENIQNGNALTKLQQPDLIGRDRLFYDKKAAEIEEKKLANFLEPFDTRRIIENFFKNLSTGDRYTIGENLKERILLYTDLIFKEDPYLKEKLLEELGFDWNGKLTVAHFFTQVKSDRTKINKLFEILVKNGFLSSDILKKVQKIADRLENGEIKRIFNIAKSKSFKISALSAADKNLDEVKAKLIRSGFVLDADLDDFLKLFQEEIIIREIHAGSTGIVFEYSDVKDLENTKMKKWIPKSVEDRLKLAKRSYQDRMGTLKANTKDYSINESRIREIDELLKEIDLAKEAENSRALKNSYDEIKEKMKIPGNILIDVVVAEKSGNSTSSNDQKKAKGKSLKDWMSDSSLVPKRRSGILEAVQYLMDIQIDAMIQGKTFHSDLHSGNILIEFEDEKVIVSVIDAGGVEKLEEKDIVALKSIFSMADEIIDTRVTDQSLGEKFRNSKGIKEIFTGISYFGIQDHQLDAFQDFRKIFEGRSENPIDSMRRLHMNENAIQAIYAIINAKSVFDEMSRLVNDHEFRSIVNSEDPDKRYFKVFGEEIRRLFLELGHGLEVQEIADGFDRRGLQRRETKALILNETVQDASFKRPRPLKRTSADSLKESNNASSALSEPDVSNNSFKGQAGSGIQPPNAPNDGLKGAVGAGIIGGILGIGGAFIINEAVKESEKEN